MSKFEIGTVTKGKVTGIQPYGAFVALNEETQGLVHISEVKHGFVKDINEHLSVGDEVNVKVLSVDESTGKIGLSIRATEAAPEKIWRAVYPLRGLGRTDPVLVPRCEPQPFPRHWKHLQYPACCRYAAKTIKIRPLPSTEYICQPD